MATERRSGQTVIVLSVNHELQGAEKRRGNVDDPMYGELLEELVDENGLDFVFEEVSGLGPTTAEKLAQSKLGSGRYWDVDPTIDEREKLSIPEASTPIMVGTPPNAAFVYWQLLEAHEKREELWIKRMTEREFKKGLMICGLAYGLSLSFRLQSKNFTVKTATYPMNLRK